MDLEKKKEIYRKALEIFLSGRKNPATEKIWEKAMSQLTDEEFTELESLVADITTEGLRERGRKRGIKTPRQTFRCDEADWKEFIRKAKARGSTASEEIRKFIKRNIEG